jgi:hypothetical protein
MSAKVRVILFLSAPAALSGYEGVLAPASIFFLVVGEGSNGRINELQSSFFKVPMVVGNTYSK